jgi:F0F1-type ATP synthase epsilon subunit
MDDTVATSDKPAARPTKIDGQDVMHVKLYSPFHVYYNDMAFSISGENATGPFDILPHHHNFMTLLGEGELLIRAPEGEQRFRIARAVMHVKADEVTVFLDV